MRRAVILLALALAGCATHRPEPVIVTRTVEVPVIVRCIPPELRPEPDYPDTDDALRNAADAAERYARMAAGRLLRMARQRETEAVINACRLPPAP